MGTDRVDYIVYGVAIRDKDIVNQYLNIFDKKYNLLYSYHDNPYKEEITESLGIHLISDGMSGRYVVIGKIIDKSYFNGFDLTIINQIKFDKKETKKLILDFDQKFETNFGEYPLSFIVFSHFH